MSDIKEYSLEYLRNTFVDKSYPGYPKQRLIMSSQELRDLGPNLSLPDGPWGMNKNENPTKVEVEKFIRDGLAVEAKSGRPLHPWLDEMITDPKIGVVSGKGFYFHWGVNATADTVVISPQDSVLLIQRKDTQQWALPGGFVDMGEDPMQAAIREVLEESMIDISHMSMEPIYQGPVVDIRVTANAWAQTHAFIALVEKEIECRGADDAFAAAWVPKHDLAATLKFGSHSVLVKMALAKKLLMAK